MDLIEKLVKEDTYTITVFHGDGVSEDDANALKECLIEKYPDIDVNFYPGGQPVYYYIISIE